MRARDRPLWTCPRCGAQLVGRHMSHACGAYTVEGFLTGRSSAARALFERFVALLETCGPVTPAPAKTRVAFMVRTRFCAVDRLSDRSMLAHFALPYRVESPRIRKIEDYNGWLVHWITLTDVDQLDQELRTWLCASYHLMGDQRRFDTKPPLPRGRGLG